MANGFAQQGLQSNPNLTSGMSLLGYGGQSQQPMGLLGGGNLMPILRRQAEEQKRDEERRRIFSGQTPFADTPAGERFRPVLVGGGQYQNTLAQPVNFGQPAQQQQQQIGSGMNPMDIMDMYDSVSGLFGGGGATAAGLGGEGGINNFPQAIEAGGSQFGGSGPIFGESAGGGAFGGTAAGTSSGGAASSGSSAGAGGGLGAAGWWAALAALIAGNEKEAREGGYRDEDNWEYFKDVVGGKVGEQDIQKRWVPKLFGEEDKYGIGAGWRVAADFSTGDYSNAWKTFKNDSTTAKVLDKIGIQL